MTALRPRVQGRQLVIFVLALAVASAGWVGIAAAADVPAAPSRSWAPWKACSGQPRANCAQVRAIARNDAGTVFLGGDFTKLRSPDGKQSVDAKNLAALDVSGRPLASFGSRNFNGTIFSLATDGPTVYAGGTFSKVDGVGALHVARFDASTGVRRTFASGVAGTVQAILLHDEKLYVGGKFATVQGQARGNLAALDAATGRLDGTWTPDAQLILDDASPNDHKHNNMPVRDLEVSPDGNRIYVAGDLDRMNGEARPALVAVDPGTGDIVPGFNVSGAGITKNYQGFQVAVADATDGRDRAGVLLAAGGLNNRAWQLNTDGSRAWAMEADGDIQAVAVSGTSVYFGGHFNTCVSTGSCYNNFTGDDYPRRFVAAYNYNYSRGGLQPPDDSWKPVMGPDFPPYYYGVWTMEVLGGDLYVGGVFNSVIDDGRTYNQPKFARFGQGWSTAPEPTPTPTPTETPTETPTPTPTPTPTGTPTDPPAGVLFQEDFSAGDLQRWDASSRGLTVDGGAATGTVEGRAAHADKALGADYDTLDYQFRINAEALDPGKKVVLARVQRQGTPATLVSLYLRPSGSLGFRNEVAGVDRNSSALIEPGSGWHTVNLRVSVADGRVEVRLDGAPVTALLRDESLGTAGANRVHLGDSAGQKAYRVSYDDVVVSSGDAPVTDPGTPTPTPTESGTPTSTPTESGTPTSTPTESGTPTSTPTESGTPTSTPTGPADPVVFSDDFSSGDLQAWNSSGQGLRVVDGAATGTVSGHPAHALKALGGQYGTLDYQFRVNLTALDTGQKLVLARVLRQQSPASLVSLYLRPSGAVGFRNEIAGKDRNSSTVIEPGSGWHTVDLRVSVADGRVEVRLDGAPVTGLVRDESLGTAGAARVHLGDLGRKKSYTIDYDDVVIRSGS